MWYKYIVAAFSAVFIFILYFPGDLRADEIPGGLTDENSFISESENPVLSREFPRSGDIKALEPAKGEGISSAAVITADILIPGGGHFYREDYFSGTLFAVLKVSSYFSVYYFHQAWRDKESLYRSARKNSESVQSHRNAYEKAGQHFLFSIAGNILISAVSLVVNIKAVNALNSDAVPAFRYSCIETGSGSEGFVFLEFSSRI